MDQIDHSSGIHNYYSIDQNLNDRNLNIDDTSNDDAFGLSGEFHLDDQMVAESDEYWAPHYLHKDGTLSPELIEIISQLNAEQAPISERNTTNYFVNNCSPPLSCSDLNETSTGNSIFNGNRRRRSNKSNSSTQRGLKRKNSGSMSTREEQQRTETEMNEEQKTELVEQLVQLIKDQTKELEDNKISNVGNNGHYSSVTKVKYCTVPAGWERRRTIEPATVIYISPSGEILPSLCSLKDYLMRSGTCKCGIPCPVLIDQTFNFNPSVANVINTSNSPLSRPGKSVCSCVIANRLPSVTFLDTISKRRSRGRPRKSDEQQRSDSCGSNTYVSDTVQPLSNQTDLERSITDILRQSSICPKSIRKKANNSNLDTKAIKHSTNGSIPQGIDKEENLAIRQLFNLVNNKSFHNAANLNGQSMSNIQSNTKNVLEDEFLPNVKLLQSVEETSIQNFAKHLIFTNPCDTKNSFTFDFLKPKSKSRRNRNKDGTTNPRRTRKPTKKETIPKPRSPVVLSSVLDLKPVDESSRNSLTEIGHCADNIYELFSDLNDDLNLFNDSNCLFNQTHVSSLEENWPGCRL